MAGRTAVTDVVVMEEMDTVVSPMVNVLDVSKFDPLMVNVSPPVRKIFYFRKTIERKYQKEEKSEFMFKCMLSIKSVKLSCVHKYFYLIHVSGFFCGCY